MNRLEREVAKADGSRRAVRCLSDNPGDKSVTPSTPRPPAMIRLRWVAWVARELVPEEDALAVAVALSEAMLSVGRTSSLCERHRCPVCGVERPWSEFFNQRVQPIPGEPGVLLGECPTPGCTGTAARELPEETAAEGRAA